MEFLHSGESCTTREHLAANVAERVLEVFLDVLASACGATAHQVGDLRSGSGDHNLDGPARLPLTGGVPACRLRLAADGSVPLCAETTTVSVTAAARHTTALYAEHHSLVAHRADGSLVSDSNGLDFNANGYYVAVQYPQPTVVSNS